MFPVIGAVDGIVKFDNNNGFYHSSINQTAGNGQHWWRMDFQTSRTIDLIRIWRRDVWMDGYTVWIGDDAQFPGSNTKVYTNKPPWAISNQPYDIATVGFGRYLFISNVNLYLSIQELDIFTAVYPENRSCIPCAANSYCPGTVENLTIQCPNSMYSLPGSSSVSQCACPVNAALIQDLNCTCNTSYYRFTNASAPLGGWQCNLCPKGSICDMGMISDCPPGYFCPTTGMSVPVVCPAGSFCPGASISATTCPAETHAPETGFSACLQCTVCQLGSFQNTPCTRTQNRSCTVCTAAKPLHAIFATTSPSCPWVCENGYWGSECVPCPANFWCKFGVQNRCPRNSISPPLSGSQAGCVCGLGYMSTGKITGTSPCVLCPAGVLCNGVPVKEMTVVPTPLANVTTQILLAQKPLPPADSMVALFASIPATFASIRATLPNKNATAYLRQVCRRTYCVACDEGTSTCIRYITVRMRSVDGYRYLADSNTTSIHRDAMYTFVNASADDCVPQISSLLSSEFVLDNVVVISSVAAVSVVRVECSSNSSMFVEIPVDPV